MFTLSSPEHPIVRLGKGGLRGQRMEPMTSENHGQKDGKTEREELPANEHSGQTPPPIIPTVAVPQRPPPAHEHNETQNKHRDWLDYMTIGLETFGLAVLVAYTTF